MGVRRSALLSGRGGRAGRLADGRPPSRTDRPRPTRAGEERRNTQVSPDRRLRAEPRAGCQIRGGLAAMTDRDAEAFEHYDDPARREPADGQPRRRRERALTQHVPVRFPASTVETVRELAEADGMSVSAWIRRTVERELAAKSAPGAERPSADAQAAVQRLQRDLADLAAALERSNVS